MKPGYVFTDPLPDFLHKVDEQIISRLRLVIESQTNLQGHLILHKWEEENGTVDYYGRIHGIYTIEYGKNKGHRAYDITYWSTTEMEAMAEEPDDEVLLADLLVDLILGDLRFLS